ncbi:MAG: 4-hydroxy-3-methylbut-2-enyl diphosphate reductase, partial [Dehalococcoidales bacterium]
VESELEGRHIEVVSTVCPFVQRAQMAAKRLANAGFYVVVYGDANHPEVQGVIGWAEGRGIATLDESKVCRAITPPYRIGILSQTTQIPAHFTDFVKKVVELALTKDSEIRVIDTICHEIRRRQASAFELAGRVDSMLVVGGRNSANTSRLARLCSRVTRVRLIETAEEIDLSWFENGHHVGITAGTSTSEDTIRNVITRLKTLS